MKKTKIIKLVLSLFFMTLLIITFINVVNHNNSEHINVIKVEKLESELYDLVTFYKYNEDSGNYEIETKYVKKDNSIYEIFNYYNTELKYNIIDVIIDNNVLKVNVTCNEIEMFTFKKMKLSYQSIDFDKLIITYEGLEIEI